MSRSALTAGIRYLRSKLIAQQLNEESDEHLLNAFLSRRDESAFAALVRRHGPMVLHVCRRVLGNHQDAEDAFQATFLVLARHAPRLRNHSSLASFLHGIAYRTAMKAKQAAARRRKHEQQAPPRPNTEPSSALLWDEVRALLDEEIGRLPEKYRSVFVLFYLQGLNREETARRLGLKEGTAASRLAEARKRLGKRLARRGVELSALLAAVAVVTPSVSALPSGLMAMTIKAVFAVASGTDLASAASVSIAAQVKINSPILSLGRDKLAVLLLSASLLASGVALAPRELLLPRGANAALLAANPRGANATPLAGPSAAKTVEIRGRILGPDGKPVKGARLYSARLQGGFPQDDVVVALAQTQPAADGRFHINLNKPNSEEFVYLIAHAAGFGVDWVNLAEDGLSSEVTLRLVKDVQIAGRVVNTEGRPVAGVSVSVARTCVPANEKLDDYLNGWYQGLNKVRDTLETPRKCLYAPLDAISGAATTDKDGRFALRGAGGERIVHVAFSGAGLARTTPFVITRPGFDAKPVNAVLQNDKDGRNFVEWNRFSGLYPPEFTFVVEAGKTIEGVIKDADTGKPLAGCKVVTATSFAHGTSAISNAEGMYRLDGLAKRASGYNVWVRPPKRSSYLPRNIMEVVDTPGFTKVKLDFKLAKGAIVTGRVVDKHSGKGVRCYFRFLPLPDNKFLASIPGFELLYTNTSREIEVGEDGRFRLVTVPGKALLTARVAESEMVHGARLCAYRQAVPDADHRNLFKPDEDTWTVALAGNIVERLSLENAVKVIDVKENGETRVDLSVDRGMTARITIQDAEGKPLGGAWAAGLTDIWPITYRLPEAAATVYALNPKKPRTMAFFHAAKKLGGTATVRGDEKDPVIVKLAPLGKVSGRLLDREGNPLRGVEVSIVAETEIGSELYRFAAPTGKPAHTDKEGRFRIEGVVPDLQFHLNLRKERTFFSGEPRIGVKQIKSGEALELGDLRVKPYR